VPYANTGGAGAAYTLNQYLTAPVIDLDATQNGSITFGYNLSLGTLNSVNNQPTLSGFAPSVSQSYYVPPTTTLPDVAGVISNLGGSVTSYTDGTATFTNGSKLVTGIGTKWISTMNGGQIELNADGVWYTIAGVTSSTNLSLTANYTNTGGTGAYTMQYLLGGSTAEDTLQTNNILTPWFQPWATLTNIPLLAFFLFLATALLALVTVEVMRATQNLLVTGIVLLAGESFCYKLGIYELWFVVITGIVLFALTIFERKPAM
jgi:hypothetical protein